MQRPNVPRAALALGKPELIEILKAVDERQRPAEALLVPEDLQKALADARAGDMRLASGPRGYYYVLVVQEAVPAEQLSFEQVADAVKKKVHDEKIQNVLDAWTEKLKKNDEVTLYLKGGDTGM